MVKSKPAKSYYMFSLQATPQSARVETTQFADESAGHRGGQKATPVVMRQMPNQSLGEFLSRPVQIHGYNWTSADAVGNLFIINPWSLWANIPSVKRKLENFAFLRCNLKVKIMVNATPFFYGAALASYRPLVKYLLTDNVTSPLSTNAFIGRSQRPHVWLSASTSTGGELTLPFIHPLDWLTISKNTDFTEMGELRVDSVTGLWNINDTSTGTIHPECFIQIFAWAEDVSMSGPTCALSLQSKPKVDEFGTGIISYPSSAIASAAGKLKDTPGLGKFATAAEIGATAVAKISSLFGFSNRPTLANDTPMVPRPFPAMSTVGFESGTEKLSLDPKNELAATSGVLGLPSLDELSISDLVQRESYLCMFSWDCGDAVDRLLFSTRVNPRMYDFQAVTNQGLVSMTPMCWVSNMFLNWRGDIIFKFRFVATPFHKGRVIISYDPWGSPNPNNIAAQAETSGLVETAIVDLGADTVVEFRVPFHQAYPWLRHQADMNAANVPFQIGNTATYNFVESYDSGFLTVRVFTDLTSPNNNAIYNGVPVIVSVRGADNLEFANPTLMPDGKNYSWFSVQSKPEVDDEEVDHMDIGISELPNTTYLINFGEKITSLREVWQRRTLVVAAPFVGVAHDYVAFRYLFGRMPPSWGFHSTGLHSSAKLAGGGNHGFNWVNWSYLAWIKPCFLGSKGGVEWTFNYIGDLPARHMRVTRRPEPVATLGTFQHSVVYTSANVVAEFFREYVKSGAAGQAVTNQLTKAGLSVILPFYSDYKFACTLPSLGHKPSTVDHGDYNTAQLDIVVPGYGGNKAGVVTGYVAAASDCSVNFFLNVPTLYVYNSKPVPA
jgi:hypothetical protein